ncbi:MAG: ABC transporter permease [Geminicoccaceae bacterium]
MTGWLRSAHPQTLRVTALALVLALVILFFGTQIDNYYTARMFNRISTSVAIILLIAIGQALVVITRNIDLSVGSIVGFTAYLVGDLLVAQPELNPLLAVLAAMALGTALGAVNGVLVAYGRVPAIIVTLGTLALYRTLLVEYSDARSITPGEPAQVGGRAAAGDQLFSIGDLDIRVTVAIALGVALVGASGPHPPQGSAPALCGGLEPDAAAIAGINAERVVFTAFLLSGALPGSPASSSSPASATSRWSPGSASAQVGGHRRGGRQGQHLQRLRHGGLASCSARPWSTSSTTA